MPERLEKLRSTLHELEAELASLDSLDDETRSRLQALKEEIAQILSKSKASSHSGTRDESVATRLQEAAEEFETSHPTLFGIISRTIDALGQMGI